jgi:hypothetical protein
VSACVCVTVYVCVCVCVCVCLYNTPVAWTGMGGIGIAMAGMMIYSLVVDAHRKQQALMS